MYIAWQILKRDLLTILFPRSEKAKRRHFSPAIQWVLTLAFWGGLYYAGIKLFGYTYGAFGAIPAIREAININLLNVMALTAFIMVVMIGFQLSYKTIYESDDVGFLLSLPIESSSVFLAKFLTSYVSIALSALTFSLPFWIAFGVVEKAGAMFYVLSVLGFFSFALLGTSIISLLLLLAMRYIPGRRLKQLFVAISAIFGIVIVLISQIVSARISEGAGQILTQIGEAQILGSWYLPSTWLMKTALSSIPRFSDGLVPAIALFGGSAITFALAVRLSEAFYLKGWAGKSEETPVRKRRHVGEKVSSTRGLFSRLQGTFWGVFKKDMKLLFREPLIWYNLAISVIVLVFFLFNVQRQASARTAPSGGLHIMGAALIMMAGMMSSVTGSQVGGISISREGQSFWVVRSNAQDIRGFFWAKALYALLPSLALTLLFLSGAKFISIPQYPLWRSLLVGFSLVSVVSVFQLLLDVYFPDFTIKVEFGSNTKTQRGTGKLLISMFGSMGLMALLIVVLMSPAFIGKLSWFSGFSEETLVWMSQGTIIALGLISLSLWYPLSKKRLSKIFFDS